MPKRKNAQKAPPSSVEERRDRSERVVHREVMSATVGDVLEALHTDAAIELLYAQDNLAAGRDLNDPTAMMGVAVVANDERETVEAAPADAARSADSVSEVAAVASVVTAAAISIAEKVAGTLATAANDAEVTATAARDRAREENATEARVNPSTSEGASREREPATPTSLLRFLSPRFVIKASRDAVSELVGGVRQARNDLRAATVRARRCFVPTAE